MKLNLLAEVEAVKKASRYPKKDDGSGVDYLAKLEYYTESTIKILQNADGIVGVITLPEKLEFGQLCKIIIDTTKSIQVVEAQQVEAEYLPLDAEKS